MMAKLVDTHFHLDYYRNHRQLYEIINELEQYTLCMTSSPGVFVSCQRMYKETAFLKFALGFHPREKSLSSKDFSDFLILASKVNYIGEVGMDFSSDAYISRSLQIDYFEKIVEMCARRNILMSVHLRKSENEAIEIIKKYHPQKCIIHWFTGSVSQLSQLISLGCYFSVNANMVQNRSTSQKVMQIPCEKILVESDGPFTKVNGKKYSPERLSEEYTIIESCLNITNLKEIVLSNFTALLQKH